MDIVTLKAVYGIVSGTVLYLLTLTLKMFGISVFTDYILVAAYLLLYVGYIPLMNLLNMHQKKHLTKGIAVYYSVSFLTWVIIYDIAPLR
ncbi:MAG: hypothetical protein RMH77_01240 [Sulfolobales archaeon]|nr:hypothetical protein [Sulfolobales archaeon]MCX8186249.1 hypothetical protein [Sulfolobales archaeon]MDW7969015.1 hypothetical protein [Sulfolobales archaeon]